MARNVEIKARIDNVESLAPRVAAIATEGPVEIVQDDTFFRCDSGRLKVRVFSSESGELIFYRRPDAHGPKESFYLRSPTTAPMTAPVADAATRPLPCPTCAPSRPPATPPMMVPASELPR